MADAVIQKTLINLCYNQPVALLFTSMCCIPDSGQESRDPVRGGGEVVVHHLLVLLQLLTVLHPGDGGLHPGVWDVDGAVEFNFVAL